MPIVQMCSRKELEERSPLVEAASSISADFLEVPYNISIFISLVNTVSHGHTQLQESLAVYSLGKHTGGCITDE